MQDIEDFTDDRLKGWCVHCASGISSAKTSWDHVPTKGLLNRPLPDHVPQVEICASCNNGFSLDEEYFVTFLSCVLAGSTDADRQINEKVGRGLLRNPSLQKRIDASRKSYTTHGGEERLIWTPEQNRINRVIVKNARGHAYYEFGEPMLDDPTHIWAMPLEGLSEDERIQFEDVGGFLLPEVGSRMLTRVLTGQDMDDGWVIVQDDIYRYAVFQDGGMVVKSVIRNYLATAVRWEN